MHTLPAIPVPLWKIIFFLQPLKYLFGDQLPLLQESIFPWFSDRIKTELHPDGDELWKRVYNTFKGPIIYYCIIVQVTVIIKISVSYWLKITLQSLDSWDALILGTLLLSQVIFEQHYFQNIYQMCAKIRASLSQVLLQKLQRISTSRLEDGQLFNIITMDLGDLDLTWLLAFSGGPIICCVGMYLLFTYFGAAAIIGIISLFCLMAFQKYITTRTGPLKQDKSKIQDGRTKLTEEILNNLPKIKMLGLESVFRDRLLQKRMEQDDKMREILKIDALAYCFNGNINVFISLFLMLSTYRIFFGNYPEIDSIFSAIWILQLMKVWCITYGQRAYKLIINLRVLQQRINDVMCLPELEVKLLETRKPTKKQKKYQQIEDEENLSIDTIDESQIASIDIINYSAYWTKLQEMENKPILNKVNLKLQQGIFMMVRGSVGSGKSSLFQAMLHEIPYFSGMMKITGHVAYVEQRPYIFSGTLQENIVFGFPFNEQHYQDVLQQSGLDRDNISPNFNVGENGSKLSGGQKARVSLSRALYSDADIYLLDDVLSAVDNNVQQLIVQTLRQLKKQGKIVILISNRYVDCDISYTMFEGELIQEDKNELHNNEKDLIVVEQAEQQQNLEEEEKQLEVTRNVYQKYIEEGGKNKAVLILILYLVDASLSMFMIKKFGECELLINLFLMMVYIFVSFTKFNEMFGFTITVINNLHRKLISTVVRMKLEYYSNIGRMMSRFTSDLNNIEGMVMLDLHWVTEGLIDNIYIILIISLNGYIIIISIVFLLLMLFAKSKFHKQMKFSLNLDDQTRGSLYEQLRGAIAGSVLIRVYNQQSRVQTDYLQSTYNNMQASFTFLRLNALLAFIIEFSLHILIIAVLNILIHSGYSQDVVGFSVLMLMQLGYMFSLNLRGQIFLDIDMQSTARVLDTIQLKSENYNGNKMHQWPSKGQIEFKNVYLQYPKATKYALTNISFQIEGGQSVGIMGRTGSGKSSIINLLLRINDVSIGSVMIDGIDIKQINLNQLRDSILVIPQNSNLFNQSIRFNLDPHKRCYDEQIWDALKKVSLYSIVQQIGLDTLDYNLSVGQQQLLSLARAFLHQTKILIFDEATANIDDQTEQLLEDALQQIESTKIIIAHRERIVSNCNFIIKLQEADDPENEDEPHHHRYSPSEGIFWIYFLYAIGLSTMASFCSGATQGLLSIDMLNLELKMKSGTEQEKRVAEVLLPVISQHHLLLSTLLVGNAFACETLPIIIHQLAPDWLAILISSGVIVLFGEIIPSAFTTGPDQLIIGMKMIPYVKVLQAILYIICYPLSLLLDFVLGVHLHQRYKIKDVRGLLNLHAQDQSGNAQLNKDQIQLMDSMMEMRKQTVMKNCKDIKKVFMISSDERYSSDLKNKIRIKGFSKIPIYQGSNKEQIIGTIQSKQILKLTAQDYGRPLSQLLQMQEPLIVPKDTTMLEMLMLFQHERKSVAFICDKGKKAQVYESTNICNLIVEDQHNIIALLGLDDVFEEMLDFEIGDEDVHGTLKDYPRHKSKYTELRVINEEQEKSGLKQKLLS